MAYTPLTGSDLYSLTSKLLLGYQMDKTLFYQLLGIAQVQRENSRPWMYLHTEDSTQSVVPASNAYANSMYLTPISLASDFTQFYATKRSIVLVAPDGITFRWYSQVPMDRKHEYKDDDTKFYVDYKNQKFYLCGTLDQNYSVHQFYISLSNPVSDTTSWVFPAQYHPILAYDVAMIYKLGFDYDVVNEQQASVIQGLAKILYENMVEWDSALQVDSIEGNDYYNDMTRPPFISRTIPPYAG